MTGSVCPTSMVPGIRSSGTSPSSLYVDIVVANEPIPRVSKKFVTNPMTMWIGPGADARCNAPRASERDR